PDCIDIPAISGTWLPEVKTLCDVDSNYAALHVACNYNNLKHINAAQRIIIASLLGEAGFHKSRMQAEEIMQRYKKIDTIMQRCVVTESPMKKMVASDRIDKLLLHPVYGNIILLAILFLLFQS